MSSRAVLALVLGIFWFLYPPQAYAECKQCKANAIAKLKAEREKAGQPVEVESDAQEFSGWDTNRTTWKKMSATDHPIKVKKKKSVPVKADASPNASN